jgi:hypothetical protein
VLEGVWHSIVQECDIGTRLNCWHYNSTLSYQERVQTSTTDLVDCRDSCIMIGGGGSVDVQSVASLDGIDMSKSFPRFDYASFGEDLKQLWRL